MADYFREMFESLKQTAEGLIQANEGIKRAVDAALAAKNEREDLRETVHRLEALMLERAKLLASDAKCRANSSGMSRRTSMTDSSGDCS